MSLISLIEGVYPIMGPIMGPIYFVRGDKVIAERVNNYFFRARRVMLAKLYGEIFYRLMGHSNGAWKVVSRDKSHANKVTTL